MQPLPLHIDLFALIMLLGVVQAAFLSVFFLSGSRRTQVANRCFGWLMLALAAIIAEIGLCYSNAIMQCLVLIDFSEPVGFAVGPLFYFFMTARLHHRLPRRWGLHLLPALIWAINSVTWFYQPAEFHYNSFIHAYHPELPYVPTRLYIPHDFTRLRPYVTNLVQLSIVVYTTLTLAQLAIAYRRFGYQLWQNVPRRLATLRNLVLLNAVLSGLVIGIKPYFQEDLGDYIFACYMTFVIYATSAFVMRGSDFYREHIPDLTNHTAAEPKKKYEKSTLSGEVEAAMLQRLNRLLTDQKLHLQPDLSLPKLATRLGTSSHHLSQLLNDRLGQGFFDWLATHRVAEAQRLLTDPKTTYLKIDEIAGRVGYNSPSAFHTAFKRITGQTPAQFRDGQSASSLPARRS